MLNFLRDYIIYKYNDSTVGFIANYFRFTGQDALIKDSSYTMFDNTSIDLLPNKLALLLSHYIHPVVLNNILVLLFIALALVSSYILYSKLTKFRSLIIIFSIFNTFSIYFIFRIISATYALMAVFLFPLALYFLVTKKNALLLSSFTIISFLFSVYYGFFVAVLIMAWFLYDLLFANEKKKTLIKVSVYCVSLLLVLISAYSNVILANLGISSKYTRQSAIKPVSSTPVIYRSLEDWYYFSFRPWYFFIPPSSSLFFGDFSRNAYRTISSTGYYLAQNYSENEMGGSYMGWDALIGLVIVLSLFTFKKNARITDTLLFKTVYGRRDLILRCFFIISVILLFTGSPIIKIKEITIYTPSYLLYQVFPTFRVLTRWAVVIFMLIITINLFVVEGILLSIKSKHIRILLPLAILFIHFIINSISLPVIDLTKIPSKYDLHISDNRIAYKYVVFPRNSFDHAFWSMFQSGTMLNLPGFHVYSSGLDADLLTRNILTAEGVLKLKETGATYLVYFPGELAMSNSTIKSNDDITAFLTKYLGEPKVESNVMVFRINK